MSGLRPSMPVEVYNSVGGGAFFRQLLKAWENAGLKVALCEALSESDYRRPVSAWGNLWRRWRMYGGYAWKSWHSVRRGRRQKPLRVVTTNPFYNPALVAWAAEGNGATVHLLYDLFPEALLLAGVARADSWLARRSAAATRFALRECAATVFLGERLRAYAEATHGRARRSVVIPVGADGDPFKDCPPQLLPAGERPRILYAGLMGRMHDTETLAKVWAEGHSADLDWIFHAIGPGYTLLRKTAGDRTDVSWGGSLGDAEWQQVMKRAQVALVTVAPGAERVVMPSKTYSALVAGQAVLAICAGDSDLADLVRRHDCGWVVAPGDATGLKTALEEIAKDARGLWEKRCHAYAAGHVFYDVRALSRDWLKLFAELAADASPDAIREARR